MQLKGYTLKNQIKSGYKINTYTGIRDEDQRPVVIKLLPFDYPNASDQSILLHEYNILKSLKFAKASQVIELIAAHNEVGPVLVLDKIEGISLSTYIKKNKITLLKFFTISLNIINVVSLIHKQNIIHKDIKPANIMINPQTLAISIIDFSIATELSAENEKFENAYILEGSLPYISPEQTGRMNQSIDYRTDYYSLGITFFEILTGSLPFKADDTLDWIHCHIAKKPPLITNINPNLPKMLAAIIEKLMAKIPDDRYASLNGLKVDIKKCETQLKQKGYIEDFTLGQNDISEHLHLNHRLIGRENETLSLLSAFERVANGASEIVFVKGYSGIGKTALVKELHKPITFKKGHFTSGKYDQLKKSKPYLGFIDAFQELNRQLLTEPEEKLNRIRNKLNENLGVNGQILINLIPNIEHIIGPQPDAPVIPISKNKSRFLKVFKSFISAVSDAESPLVIFLDDLQWIDIASLQLLESLTLENFATHILIIGSYRDNEIDENHPLHDLKIKLIKSMCNLNEINLRPLTVMNIETILTLTFGVDNKNWRLLAGLIFAKTQGNPFFINEFIKSLCKQGILKYSDTTKRWEFDATSVKLQSITTNVIDLLRKKILSLSLDTQDILKKCACIGYHFDFKTVCIICEKPLDAVIKGLTEALKENLITSNNNYILDSIHYINCIDQASIEFEFIHDRILQAVYESIPPSELKENHYKIGKLLLEHVRSAAPAIPPLVSDSEPRFDGSFDTNKISDKDIRNILVHYNECLNFITSESEAELISKLNYDASLSAKLSNALFAEENYLNAALYLRQKFLKRENDSLLFAIRRELSICYVLRGEFNKANAFFNILLKNANSNSEKIEIYNLNCQMLVAENKQQEAVLLGIKALKLAGISIPFAPSKLKVLLMLAKIKFTIFNLGEKIFHLPPMTSADYIAASNLIVLLGASSYSTNESLIFILSCNDMLLSLQHGYNKNTAYSFLPYAFICMHTFNFFKDGLQARAVSKRLENNTEESVATGRICAISGVVIEPWLQPFEKCLDLLYKGQSVTRDFSDVTFENYCNLGIPTLTFTMGRPLSEVKKEFEFVLNTVSSKVNECWRMADYRIYLIDCLMKEPFSSKKMLIYKNLFCKSTNNSEVNSFYGQAIKFYSIMNFHDEAIALGQEGRVSNGFVSSEEGLFYYALSS